jgi:hypothetical protein
VRWTAFTGPAFIPVLYRAKVPGGWLICTVPESDRSTPAIAFLPDPGHTWDPDD